MGLHQDYKMFKHSGSLNSARNQYIYLHYLITISQLFSVVFFMLLNIHQQLQGSLNFIFNFLLIIQQNYLTQSLVNIFCYLGIICGIFLIVNASCRLFNLPNYDQIQKRKILQRFQYFAQILVMFIFQTCSFFIFWSYSQIYFKQGLFFFIIKSLIPTSCAIVICIKYQTVSLFGWMTVLIAYQLIIFKSTYSYLLMAIISIYLLLVQKQLIKKVSYGLIIILSIFMCKNSLILDDIASQNMQLTLIFVVLLMLLMPIAIIRNKQRIKYQNAQQKLRDSFNILIKLKQQIPFQQLQFNKFYRLYDSIMNVSNGQNIVRSMKIEQIRQKSPQKISKIELLYLLQKYIETQCIKSDNNNVFNKILKLNIKINLNYSIKQINQDIYNLHSQIISSKDTYKEMFFQMFDQVIKKYTVSHKQGQLQIAYTLNLNKLHEEFQTKITQLLNRLMKLWQLFSFKHIKKIQINHLFLQILYKQQQIISIYQQIKKHGNFNKQLQIINHIHSLINVYSNNENRIQNIHNILGQNNINNINQDIKDYNFIILQDNIIKYISKDLLLKFKSYGNQVYIHQHQSTIFGQQFSIIINNMIHNINIKSQSQWLSIPILCKQSLVQLKNIKLLYYPSLDTKNKVMIKIQDDFQLDHNCFLIYHFKSDTIKYFNHKFIQIFNIDQQKFHYTIHNYQLFFNQLFINSDVPTQNIKDYLKQENSIRCIMYLKKYIDKGKPSEVPVEIKSIRCIQIKNQPAYCILKISKLKQKKKSNDAIQCQTKKDKAHVFHLKKFLNLAETQLAQKYANEQFFCKIPNNYASKIKQKQSQWLLNDRWVYRHFIHIVFGVMFLTILRFWILGYQLMNTRIQKYKNEILALQNTSQQYAMLYQSYAVITKRYYFEQYPQQIQFVRGIPAAIEDNFYKILVQRFIDQFMQKYLYQLNSQTSKQISYNLQFQYFNISTDTSQSTLIDLVQHLRINIQTNEYKFLIDNYDNFRELTLKYENSIEYENELRNIESISMICSRILIVSTSIFLMIMFVILMRIELVIESVYILLEMIQIKQFRETMIDFNDKVSKISLYSHKQNEIKQQLDQDARQIDEDGKQSKQHDSIRTKNEHNTNIKTNHSIKRSINNKNNNRLQQGNKNYKQIQNNNKQIKNNNIEQSNNLFDQQSIQLSSQINNQQQAFKQIKPQFIDQSFLIKIQKYILFVILLVSFNFIFVIDYIGLIHQNQGIIQIFDINKNLYIALLHIKRQQVDAPMIPIMEHFYNKSIPNKYHNSNIYLTTQIPTNMILDQFKQSSFNLTSILYQNICDHSGIFSNALIKPCDTYLNGSLTQGFSQAFDIFYQNARQLSSQSLSQFGLYKCTVEQCPPYFEHEVASALMGQVIRHMIDQLKDSSYKAFNIMLQNCKINIIYKMLSLIVVLIGYAYWNYKITKRSQMAIRYFKIIPKQLMYNSKITSYMRKNNTLSNFDIL